MYSIWTITYHPLAALSFSFYLSHLFYPFSHISFQAYLYAFCIDIKYLFFLPVSVFSYLMP